MSLLGGIVSQQTKVRAVASVAPLVTEEHIFDIPSKLIKTPGDMKIWEKSEAYFEYMGFILAINDAIKGKSNSQGSQNLSESVVSMVGVLDKLDALIDETPPIKQPQRFGNIAFRTWYQKMRDDSLNLLQEVLRTEFYKAIPEIVSYLVDSFGNSTRIDYGTGHEISFIMFMCCLFKIGVLTSNDKIPTGCYIFPRYLDLVRKLQKTYRMEPAGSHGVWSLDDYQFVPFIWGSSQLVAHPVIEPSSFLNQQILNDYGEDYMFLTCIKYINSVKSGPFAEHSNQLWSISGVSSWSKINGGLIKMYKVEVLGKFPVIQHIVFGSLFTLKSMEQATGMMTAKLSMEPPPIQTPSSIRLSQGSTESSTASGEKSKSASQASVSEAIKSESVGSVGSISKEASKSSVEREDGSEEPSEKSPEIESLKPHSQESLKMPQASDLPSIRSEDLGSTTTETVRFSIQTDITAHAKKVAPTFRNDRSERGHSK